MAELVDAPDSKSGFRKKVQVRFLFWAHGNSSVNKGSFFGLFFSKNLQVKYTSYPFLCKFF